MSHAIYSSQYNKVFAEWVDGPNGMSLPQIARKLNLSLGAVLKWYYCEREPRLSHAVAIEDLSKGEVPARCFVDERRRLGMR